MTKTTPGITVGTTDQSAKKTKYVKLISLVALVIALVSLAGYQIYRQRSAEDVFWGAVNNNLSTTAFTRHTTEQDGAQTTDQITETVTAPTHLIHAQNTIDYQGGSGVKISTENLGTPTVDYVRYTSIKTDQKTASGAPLDFSKVLGVWGKTEAAAGGVTSGQQYSESVLGAVPFGNLNPKDRATLIRDMKAVDLYKYKVVKTSKSGLLQRPTYTISVEVKTAAYINILKEYAHFAGLTQLNDVDATQYASAAPVEIELVVDGWSHQIQKIDYGQGAHVEYISNYGSVRPAPEIPKNTVSVQQLQTELQKIQ